MTTTGNETTCVTIWGRCVKPVAIGPLLVTVVLFVNQILALLPNYEPILLTPNSSLGAIAALSGLSSLFMIWSWIGKQQIMYEVGLLFGVGAWAGRAVEVSLDNTGFQGILPLGFAVTMAGLYVAETSNRWDVV